MLHRATLLGPLALASVLACGPPASETSADAGRLVLPKGAVHVDFDPLAATFCPECSPTGDLAHVLVAGAPRAALAESGGALYAAFEFERWRLVQSCNLFGCTSGWGTETLHACFEVSGGRAALSTSSSCPALPPPPATVRFDALQAAREALRSQVGSASTARTPDGTEEFAAVGALELTPGRALVDYTAWVDQSLDLGGALSPPTWQARRYLGLVRDGGVDVLLPAPDGQPVLPRLVRAQQGTWRWYWADRLGTVVELSADPDRLTGRTVRSPVVGAETKTAAVLETDAHVVTLVLMPSTRRTLSGGGAVYELVTLETPPLRQPTRPLVPFAPSALRTPDPRSAVICFTQRLDGAALSAGAATGTDGLTLQTRGLLPGDQCLQFDTSPQQRSTSYRVTVKDFVAVGGERLTPHELSLFPDADAADAGATP